ncbi:hypothetical protein [Mycobacterium sp. NPDC004974]
MSSDQTAQLFTIAAQDGGPLPRAQLFRALAGKEMYYAATAVEVDGGRKFSTPLRRLDDGSLAMLVYSSKRHPELPQHFAGAHWPTLLEIAHESLQADWLVITNLKNETVAISREHMPAVIADLRGDELEMAISCAVDARPEDWFESALAVLRGRELYLHLRGNASPGAQQTMHTSSAAGRSGWILAYTTRTRPGITYGGITWESLVDMTRGAAEIPGVQIVNDGNDWIILGRDVI